jgi:hypothetical protein
MARNIHKRPAPILVMGDFAGALCLSVLGDPAVFRSCFRVCRPAFERWGVSLRLKDDGLFLVFLLPLCDMSNPEERHAVHAVLQQPQSYDRTYTTLFWRASVSERKLSEVASLDASIKKRPWMCQGRSVCSQLFIPNQESHQSRTTVCQWRLFCQPGFGPRHQTTRDHTL